LPDYCSIDGTFVPWATKFRESVLAQFPLLTGVDPIPDEAPLPPKWTLQFAQAQGQPETGYQAPIRGGMNATVTSNTRVTPESHFQDTRTLHLSVPGHHDYLPGATVTIFPQNADSDVEAFIQLMDWTTIADTPLQFISTDTNQATSQPPVAGVMSSNLTIRSLLTNHLDIMSIPRRSFFKHLLHLATDETQVERLQEFVSPELIDELYDYTTRPRRSILEALADFTSVKLPWQSICDIIPLIRGRKFSIASGGTFKFRESIDIDLEETHIELLIAIVKYRTIIRRIRHGLATRYIANLQPGQIIQITLQPASALGIIPGDFSKPVVMVAPGTGIAPMRALALDRKFWRNDQPPKEEDKDLLFFGCRSQGVDEYFASEWNALDVTRWTAFSRDQVSSST
jgi:sulfite reductase alpha subunit-like flavoprotein